MESVVNTINKLDESKLPALFIHSDDTVSIVLTEAQINRIKLCSKDIVERIDDENAQEWYTFSRVTNHGLVWVVRMVKPMIRIPFSEHIDIKNITIKPYKLSDWSDMVDTSLKETMSSKLLEEMIRIIK